MSSARQQALAARILRGLEKSKVGAKERKDLPRDMVELNVLRAFGAAVNEHLERASILAALEDHMPRLFDYAVMLTLIEAPERPELHVYPRVHIGTAAMDRAIAGVLEAYNRLRDSPLSLADITVSVREPDEAPRRRRRAEPTLDSHITLPLVAGGERAGCLSIAQVGRDAFEPVKVQLFSLIAYQLGATLRHSVLLEQTREKAVRDPLTGLFNRRHFTERLDEECRRARRYHHPVALILCDIDNFKSINDRFGHPVGDRVLQRVTRALSEGARTSDTVCRYGGEEFAIVLPETSVEEAVVVAERLRTKIPGAMQDVAELDTSVHMSFGVAAIDAHDGETRADGLVLEADSALYLAKRTGRDRVCASAKGRIAELRKLATPDKRRFLRVKSQLQGRLLLVPDLGDTAEQIRLVDISAQGMRLIAKRALPMGAFVLVELEHGVHRPMRVLAKVVWTSPRRDRTIVVGVRILAFDATSEPRVMKIVDTGQPAR